MICFQNSKAQNWFLGTMRPQDLHTAQNLYIYVYSKCLYYGMEGNVFSNPFQPFFYIKKGENANSIIESIALAPLVVI